MGRIRTQHRIKLVEEELSILVQQFEQLHKENRKARAKDHLLSACLELLHWMEQQQQQEALEPQASSSSAAIAACLEAADQMLVLLPPSPCCTAGHSSSSSTTASTQPSPSAADLDAWRSSPMAPDARDPLAVMKESLQRPPHPGAGPQTTKQQLVKGYSALCSELALHMRVLSNPRTPAESAAISARNTKQAVLDWYHWALSMLLDGYAPLIAELMMTDCTTGEIVLPDVEKLYEAALERVALSPEQQERIADSYEVFSQLHSASLREAMALQGCLDQPAEQLFASSALPVGMLQQSAQSDAGQQYEQHQASLQRLRVAMKKAYFWDNCLSACFLGALTINQVCELCLSVYPHHPRLNIAAHKVALIQQQHLLQEAAVAQQLQEVENSKKGRRRQKAAAAGTGAAAAAVAPIERQTHELCVSTNNGPA